MHLLRFLALAAVAWTLAAGPAFAAPPALAAFPAPAFAFAARRPGRRILHGERDLFLLFVHGGNPNGHHVAGEEGIKRILRERIGELRDVHEAILLDAKIHERAEARYVGNHAGVGVIFFKVAQRF